MGSKAVPAQEDDEMEEGVDELFHAAADHLAQLVTANPASVPDAVKLQLYGLYKQAIVGQCSTPKPVFWDRAAVSKWYVSPTAGTLFHITSCMVHSHLCCQREQQWHRPASIPV